MSGAGRDSSRAAPREGGGTDADAGCFSASRFSDAKTRAAAVGRASIVSEPCAEGRCGALHGPPRRRRDREKLEEGRRTQILSLYDDQPSMEGRESESGKLKPAAETAATVTVTACIYF